MLEKTKNPPCVNFKDTPLNLDTVLTCFGMPPRLQKRKRRIDHLNGCTKEQVRVRLKMMFLQEGEVRLDEGVWYQVYGNLNRLYLCLFAADNTCVQTYLFSGWIKYVLWGKLKSFITGIKNKILFGIGKSLLWILNRGTRGAAVSQDRQESF